MSKWEQATRTNCAAAFRILLSSTKDTKSKFMTNPCL